MEVIRRLHAACADRAARTRVAALVIGIGYTAVATEDGAVGLSYTWFGDKTCCSFMRGWDDAEGAPASDLLDRLLSNDAFERSVGMATANALNHEAALDLPSDAGPAGALIRVLGLERGSCVAMVGYFPPVVRELRELGTELEVIDEARGMGDQRVFRERLGDWADALIMTSTTLLNDSAEDLLGCAGAGLRAAFLGPTTPLAPAAFSHLPVDVLAGMAPVDTAKTLRAVRHGAGTPELQRFARKVYCVCGGGAASEASL